MEWKRFEFYEKTDVLGVISFDVLAPHKAFKINAYPRFIRSSSVHPVGKFLRSTKDTIVIHLINCRCDLLLLEPYNTHEPVLLLFLHLPVYLQKKVLPHLRCTFAMSCRSHDVRREGAAEDGLTFYGNEESEEINIRELGE